jgi:hypothetical protein
MYVVFLMENVGCTQKISEKRALMSYHHYEALKIIYGYASVQTMNQYNHLLFVPTVLLLKTVTFQGCILQDSPRKRLLLFHIIQPVHPIVYNETGHKLLLTELGTNKKELLRGF